jgi:nucleosome binding factor SPN SPT16 subunit
MISIGEQGPDILTKLHKSLADISYTINDEDAEEDDEDDDDDDIEEEEEEEEERKPKKKKSTQGDAALARKIAKEEQSRATVPTSRKSSRLAKHAEAAEDIQEGSAIREKKQIELMKRRNEERLQELARGNRKDGQNGGSDQPDELETYRRTKDYPDNIQPNQVKVDMANQCVILPICGNPIPFHISTIKNVVLPDPDSATYLRINFYTAGMAVGKDAPENMAKLVAKYAPYATFIREMTFRSLDSQNLTLAFRQISELRKRARTRELRLQEEANLVEQEKLVRTKNERVPRLSDLTMRPVVAGRKTQGNLEAHSNGLRFISTRAEVVDIMYANIKYAIFQPCENEIMVLVHFHLKNAIMVGKKRQFDIQFFTEVVDASQTVDAGRRSMYDPDEMDDEQRERQLRKKLNSAFREFCKKVDAVAKKNNFNLEFDIPYRDLGFIGNPHKEMVMIQPTLNCLVNLTETPFFVVDLADLDHVHFERVTYMSKAFDIVLINKDFTKQPWRIDMIDNGDKDAIQDWLTDMEITYTEGPMNLNWKQIIQTVASDDRFYMNTEEDEVTDKEAGWEFLRLYGHEDDEEDDEEDQDSGYSDAPGEEEEDDDDDDDEDDEFDSEDDDDDDDFDADEELEEQGMDWEDMEKQAILDDRRGRNQEANDRHHDHRTNDPKKRRHQSGKAPPPSSKRRSTAPPPNKLPRRR